MPFDLDALAEDAMAAGASDIHLSTSHPPLIRACGRLARISETPLDVDSLTALASHLAGASNWDTLQQCGEVDFGATLSTGDRVRVNIYRQRHGLAIALRLIPSRVPTLQELGLPEVLSHLAQRQSGLVLVTGATGSGKSTTLAAMIDQINTEQATHIITLEDPIEYIHTSKRSLVHQRQVGSDTGSFQTALRAALRQDPDVILVGEMRDLETIRTAVQAAETGHLVLATLHTIDAAQSLDRIIDAFSAEQQAQVRIQLAGCLQGIISQRLFPRCDGPGLVAAVEVLIATPAVRHLLREGKTHQIPSLIQTSGRLGMRTMQAAVQELFAQGLISREEHQTFAGAHGQEDAAGFMPDPAVSSWRQRPKRG